MSSWSVRPPSFALRFSSLSRAQSLWPVSKQMDDTRLSERPVEFCSFISIHRNSMLVDFVNMVMHMSQSHDCRCRFPCETSCPDDVRSLHIQIIFLFLILTSGTRARMLLHFICSANGKHGRQSKHSAMCDADHAVSWDLPRAIRT